MIDLGIYITETITRPSHTETRSADMLSFNVACNPFIADTRTSMAHTEAGAVDMLSFKVVYNPPGKMVAEIARSRGPWGYM